MNSSMIGDIKVRYEILGRNLLYDMLKDKCEEIKFVDLADKYSDFDAMMVSGGTKYIIEIKYRNFDLGCYDEWWFDERKITKLGELKRSFPEYEFLACIVTRDGKLVLWDISNRDEDPETHNVLSSQLNGVKKNKSHYTYRTKNGDIYG